MDNITRKTQASVKRGKRKTFYIMQDIEEKADQFCKKENISFSLLVRIAIEQLLEKEKEESNNG